MNDIQCILGYPNLDYPNAKFHKLHPHYESHVGLGDCEILQNGVFQSQCGVLKMYYQREAGYLQVHG